MTGGIAKWSGMTATRQIDRGLPPEGALKSLPEAIKYAYGMEVSSMKGYLNVAAKGSDEDVSALLKELAEVEGEHKKLLLQRWVSLGLAQGELEATAGPLTESGLTTGDFTEMFSELSEDRAAVIETAMAMEMDALDLYLTLAERHSEDADTKKLFEHIARGEVAHLKMLGGLIG